MSKSVTTNPPRFPVVDAARVLGVRKTNSITGPIEIGSAMLDAMPMPTALVKATGEVLHLNDPARVLLGGAQGRLLDDRGVSNVSALGEAVRQAVAERGGSSQVVVRVRNGSLALEGSANEVMPLKTVTTPSHARKHAEPSESAEDNHLWVVVLDNGNRSASLQAERDRLLKVAAVGELVPTILHELKNPLSAVTTAVELLLEELENSTAQSDLHAVLTELHRMRLMLDGVGSVGQSLRSDRARAIDQALREAIQVLSRHASDQQIELDEQVEDLPLLKLEPTVLRAVVFNLVMNAIQASEPGKRITLVVSLIDHGSRLKIQVRDQGCGMPPEVLTRCRELFYTTKPRGTGVGLALCNQVMDEVGGDLEIDSALGHGTTVTLLIPLPTHKKLGSTRQEMWVAASKAVQRHG